MTFFRWSLPTRPFCPSTSRKSSHSSGINQHPYRSCQKKANSKNGREKPSARLGLEAAVCGGIPIINTLQASSTHPSLCRRHRRSCSRRPPPQPSVAAAHAVPSSAVAGFGSLGSAGRTARTAGTARRAGRKRRREWWAEAAAGRQGGRRVLWISFNSNSNSNSAK